MRIPYLRRTNGLLVALCLAIFVASPALAGEARPQLAGGRSVAAPVLGLTAPDVIADRYIVVFRKGTARTEIRAAVRGSRQVGAAVHHRYSAALSGFAATLTKPALAALRGDPDVAFIEADRRYRYP